MPASCGPSPGVLPRAPSEAGGLPPPVVLALIPCEYVEHDPDTGIHSIRYIFNRIDPPRFPAGPYQFAVYAALSNVHGRIQVTLRLVDADDAEPPLRQAGGPCDSPDGPLAVVFVYFILDGVTVPRPGFYRLQLLCEGACLLERRIEARLRPQG
jgi:Family of unknown function (DUF6941)